MPIQQRHRWESSPCTAITYLACVHQVDLVTRLNHIILSHPLAIKVFRIAHAFKVLEQVGSIQLLTYTHTSNHKLTRRRLRGRGDKLPAGAGDGWVGGWVGRHTGWVVGVAAAAEERHKFTFFPGLSALRSSSVRFTACFTAASQTWQRMNGRSGSSSVGSGGSRGWRQQLGPVCCCTPARAGHIDTRQVILPDFTAGGNGASSWLICTALAERSPASTATASTSWSVHAILNLRGAIWTVIIRLNADLYHFTRSAVANRTLACAPCSGRCFAVPLLPGRTVRRLFSLP